VAIWAFDDANKRAADASTTIRDESAARLRARPRTISHEGVEPAPALGFKASVIFHMAVQYKRCLDVWTSICVGGKACFGAPRRVLSSAWCVSELLVSHQKIVDTRFRQ
jgi:hypothetical protein